MYTAIIVFENNDELEIETTMKPNLHPINGLIEITEPDGTISIINCDSVKNIIIKQKED